MKKRITAIILALALCLATIAGISMTGGQAVTAKKAGKEVQNLKKLQKALKKKKKKTISKTFKTETGGTESKKYQWYKHKAAVQLKGKKIIFTDTVKRQYPETGGTFTSSVTTVKMVMKVGTNKKVKVTMKQRYLDDAFNEAGDYIGYKWVNEKSSYTSFKPAAYKKGIELKWKKGDSGNTMMLFTCFRCWNSLVKKGKVNMKSLGFKKFKPVSIEQESYYH